VQTRSRILDSHITKQISTVSLDQRHWKILPLSCAMLPSGRWPRHQSIFVYC